MKTKGFTVFLSVLALYFFALQNAHAAGPKDFTNADLMSFTIEQRHSYYIGSMISISHVISMYDKKKGQCFSDWFFEDVNKRVREIEADIKKNPEQVPSVIMITLPELKCGIIGKQ